MTSKCAPGRIEGEEGEVEQGGHFSLNSVALCCSVCLRCAVVLDLAVLRLLGGAGVRARATHVCVVLCDMLRESFFTHRYT